MSSLEGVSVRRQEAKPDRERERERESGRLGWDKADIFGKIDHPALKSKVSKKQLHLQADLDQMHVQCLGLSRS